MFCTFMLNFNHNDCMNYAATCAQLHQRVFAEIERFFEMIKNSVSFIFSLWQAHHNITWIKSLNEHFRNYEYFSFELLHTNDATMQCMWQLKFFSAFNIHIYAFQLHSCRLSNKKCLHIIITSERIIYVMWMQEYNDKQWCMWIYYQSIHILFQIVKNPSFIKLISVMYQQPSLFANLHEISVISLNFYTHYQWRKIIAKNFRKGWECWTITFNIFYSFDTLTRRFQFNF